MRVSKSAIDIVGVRGYTLARISLLPVGHSLLYPQSLYIHVEPGGADAFKPRGLRHVSSEEY